MEWSVWLKNIESNWPFHLIVQGPTMCLCRVTLVINWSICFSATKTPSETQKWQKVGFGGKWSIFGKISQFFFRKDRWRHRYCKFHANLPPRWAYIISETLSPSQKVQFCGPFWLPLTESAQIIHKNRFRIITIIIIITIKYIFIAKSRNAADALMQSNTNFLINKTNCIIANSPSQT